MATEEKTPIIYFWSENNHKTGFLSQWYISCFKEYENTNEEQKMVTEFNCCEQYMMYNKAMLFGDTKTSISILNESRPRTQKSLGRVIDNFNDEEWNKHKENIVYRGNYLKFSQNQDLADKLLSFPKNCIFVEASPYDKIWGIGLTESVAKKRHPDTWPGQNLLGIALGKVRDKLLSEKEQKKK